MPPCWCSTTCASAGKASPYGPQFAPWTEEETDQAAPPNRLQQAAETLREQLEDGEWHPLAEVKAQLAAAGFGERMARLALGHVCPDRRKQGTFVHLCLPRVEPPEPPLSHG